MEVSSRHSGGLPAPQGLYDGRNEHDACGIGFLADVQGRRSHEILRDGVRLLNALAHRAAVGADPRTGDGAGILIQLPHRFFAEVATEHGFWLPEEGEYGVGMFFFPQNGAHRLVAERVVERVFTEMGMRQIGWRAVPTDPDALGQIAREAMPVIMQLFVARDGRDEVSFERQLYLARRRIENAVEQAVPGSDFYVVSLSSRTIIYKGLLIPVQIPFFYRDLSDSRVETAVALVHSRFSTNTFPTWARAHPYRMLCHNGEINTLRGNINWMRVREGRVVQDDDTVFGREIADLMPVVMPGGSDSAALDNALEFLVLGGRSLPHAMAMLIPEAWGGDPEMTPDRKAFYEYHASLMEPWDGPAAVAFCDGKHVGAMLDRNGLRPARWCLTEDGRAILASEAGALPVDPANVKAKGRLQPGMMFLVDMEEGRVIGDAELKTRLASARPYREWVDAGEVTLESLPEPEPVNAANGAHGVNGTGHAGTNGSNGTRGGAAGAPHEPLAPVSYEGKVPLSLLQRQTAFGYTQEDLKILLTPMATTGQEPVGSMGNDTPLAVLSDRPQLLFKYFKQLFAQVTNPPIDPIREELVMSLNVLLGPRGNVLEELPEHARKILLKQPILTPSELAKIKALDGGFFRARTLETLFPAAPADADPDEAGAALGTALEQLLADAAQAVRDGCNLLVLSDRNVGPDRAIIPSLLAVSAVHHHLIRERLRTSVDLILETGESLEVPHYALLVGYGAAAICPYLALETVEDMAANGYLGELDGPHAREKYIKSIGKGLLKIFSKMGISTLQSYAGAQVFEAVGLDGDMVERYFTGTASRIGGVTLAVLGREALARHQAAFAPATPLWQLDPGGEYMYRSGGERHGWNPKIIATLQQATRNGDAKTFEEFSRLANEACEVGFTLKGLLDFVERDPIPLEEVEPASEIVKRFVTGAMSFGSISREAHETMAIAMNRIGGRSNTGEGGEDPERFLDERNSAIKQVASGRFGVTTEYLVNARELQIKMAQGAKPGEGGQLPGHKVDETIAKTRHSTPGVTLISPPPHHDIYSIEDLAQLILDLKTVNPRAAVSVKLVAAVGVGTIAAGVAKAHADLVVISGDGGGTGASPLSSIKHAGIPWELGLAETQQTLVLNGLRGRIRVQADGQLKTGRDVVTAALLGADEYGFSTAPLIVQGCLMMRKCHLNTCPVGIATQDPALRAKFTGQAEHVINYFFFVAEEARKILARLGLRSMAEAVGRSDLLKPRVPQEHWKARNVHLEAMLHLAGIAEGEPLHCVEHQPYLLEQHLDHLLVRLAMPALEHGERVRADAPIRNSNRSVGAMLSGEVAKRFGHKGLPENTIELRFKGSAGQSFGAFGAAGITMRLEGEGNDYVGKGLSGARLIIVPPPGSHFAPEDTIIVGNTVLYGATGGEAYIYGMAGERFAVRNSGAVAVIEGVGDHGCEYMTGGTVVVLGRTGRNFAAGMSGGLAYVLDEDGTFRMRVNTGMVAVEDLAEEAHETVRDLVARYVAFTGSVRAAEILRNWDECLPRFVQVVPLEYRRVLEQRAAALRLAAARATEQEVALHG